ncbi:MAG TPA: hypothetical protein VGO43_09555 [Pyrinomonadaceae bacterium]|jgi:hypothetical protein|nr:hypothetical protein [Pyrinomonadaceae bacterium]
MSPKDKARLLGIFLWAFTALNVVLIGLIAVIYLGIMGAVFSNIPHKAGDPPPETIMGILIVVFAFVFIFTLLFSIPKVIAGYGLRKEKPWARTWAIIASIMCCLSFPIGTAIGVFGLIFLFDDAGKRYFEDPSYGRAELAPSGGMNVPPPNSWQ